MSRLHEGKTVSTEVKCDCQRCGQHIAFPLEMAGQDVTCPHCGRETTLLLPQVRKTGVDPNVPIPHDERHEMPNGTKIWVGIIGVAVVVIPLLFFIYHQNEETQAERNYQELTNPFKESYSEKAKAEEAARREHHDYLWSEVTNGIASAQFEYATNLLSDHNSYLTDEALTWLQKAADQGYQPAIDLLATCEPKSKLDSIDSFLWENRETDLSETENDFSSTYNPAVFNGGSYITYNRSIIIADGKIVLKAEDKIHDDNDRELTDMMSKEAANNKIDFEIGNEAQINPIFERFLEWGATANENNVENVEKQIVCVTNRFGGTLGSAQVVRTYTFSWQDGQARLFVKDSSRDTVTAFSTEDVVALQNLLLQLPQMKQKLADAIRNKEAQKSLFH